MRQSNYAKDQKRDEIQAQKHEAELIRLRTQRRQAYQQACEERNRLVSSLARKYRSMIIREEAVIARERKQRSNSDKAVIEANIKNFYRDRIDMLKGHIETQRSGMVTVESERKFVKSTLVKEKKQRKAAQIAAIHSALERERMNADMELKQIEEQLIAMYKRA